MVKIEHDVHPFEEHAILHGGPEIAVDVLNHRYPLWYQLDDECEHWTVEEGEVRPVPYGNDGRHYVKTDCKRQEDVVGPLTKVGCTFIQVVQAGTSYGGLGFKAVQSHLGCDECLVLFTMMA